MLVTVPNGTYCVIRMSNLLVTFYFLCNVDCMYIKFFAVVFLNHEPFYECMCFIKNNLESRG